MKSLNYTAFTTKSGHTQDLVLSYELFGQDLYTAPVVLVNHALTGNSTVSGPKGWWSELIGPGKTIDTDYYTVLAFNIPGNGYDGFLIENYTAFVAQDIARVFLWGLQQLEIDQLFAIIGGSLGGGIAWEMAALDPTVCKHLIPVATDWKSTDWLIANCQIQEQILSNSSQPVHDARMHAMMCYRTPESFNQRFQRSTNEEEQLFNVETWLLHHGDKLQDRFQLSAYHLMNQLLKTIDITRDSTNISRLFDGQQLKIHIVGVNSDLFFTAAENKNTYRHLAQSQAQVTYGEIESLHGHDAFLIEFDQLSELLQDIFTRPEQNKGVKVVKFGGKSLQNEQGFERVLDIVADRYQKGQELVLVLSARGRATDQLEKLLEEASNGREIEELWNEFAEYQSFPDSGAVLTRELQQLETKLQQIKLNRRYTERDHAEVLSYGELLSARLFSSALNERGIAASLLDARSFLTTDARYEEAKVDLALSKKYWTACYQDLPQGTIPVVTGFIAASPEGHTTTLGRNGSNYSAALIANFLNAEEVINYTHVDGLFSAPPDQVDEARLIRQLSFEEANELVQFGAHILHAKTIIPLLEKNIPLHILNTFNPRSPGTRISTEGKKEEIKAVSLLNDNALLLLEGRGLLDKVGVDARIFSVLAEHRISVSVISQGASERGIGLVVQRSDAEQAHRLLEKEFQTDLGSDDLSQIQRIEPVSILSVVGEDAASFYRPYRALVRNQLTPLLFNNSPSGRQLGLVFKEEEAVKALRVVHGELYGTAKRINLLCFGKGQVGATLLDQLLEEATALKEKKNIDLRVIGILNSTHALLTQEGVASPWRTQFEEKAQRYQWSDFKQFIAEGAFENLVAIDNTASESLIHRYEELAESGFDLISSNKLANTQDYGFYKALRTRLKNTRKTYLYETNVGAGLPLIDTIRLLHESGDNITKIRGVFSGSLGSIFSGYSQSALPFSTAVLQASEAGYTEPDPREDLSGRDVARKLLILARELQLQNEFEDISIENLVPETLQHISLDEFQERITELDQDLAYKKSQLKEGEVLRYVGELSGDLMGRTGELRVSLEAVPKNSPLGQVEGPDSLIEIYTDSYGERPLVIQGAGAGPQVTARGVFGDVLRISERI